jgi:hypothetical protein
MSGKQDLTRQEKFKRAAACALRYNRAESEVV